MERHCQGVGGCKVLLWIGPFLRHALQDNFSPVTSRPRTAADARGWVPYMKLHARKRQAYMPLRPRNCMTTSCALAHAPDDIQVLGIRRQGARPLWTDLAPSRCCRADLHSEPNILICVQLWWVSVPAERGRSSRLVCHQHPAAHRSPTMMSVDEGSAATKSWDLAVCYQPGLIYIIVQFALQL